MTTTTISVDTARRRSLGADLAFWTAVGAIAAAFDGPLSRWWHASSGVLLIAGLSLAVFGATALIGLGRIRRVPRALVAGFGVGNVVLAPVAAAASWFGWLGVSAAGNEALAGAAAVTLLLGAWQLAATGLTRRPPGN